MILPAEHSSTRRLGHQNGRPLSPTFSEHHRPLCQDQVRRDALTVHADNGSSMASKPVAFLLADLGVTKTHSRPHTSNDNPFSESQFRTLKYRPEFPATFASLPD